MAIFLLILLWIVGVIGALSVLLALHTIGSSRKNAAALFSVALICFGVGLFISMSEPLMWRRAANDDTIVAYQEYVSRNPKGKHVTTARARLKSLPGEITALRKGIVTRFAALKRESSLGGVLAGEFLRRSESSLKVLYRHSSPWPTIYADTDAQLDTDDVFRAFGSLVRADITNEHESATPGVLPPDPPFGGLTLVLSSSGELYGSYKLQGGMLGQTAEGIVVHVQAQLFQPNETTPTQVFEFDGAPGEDIKFSKSFGDITSEAEMRTVLLNNSYAHVAKAIREALLLEVPVASEGPKQ